MRGAAAFQGCVGGNQGSEPTALLKIENVGFSYPSGFRLEEIDLEVTTGSFLALIGPNGCGKSTLVKLMSRLLPPSTGKVLLEGRELASYSTRELARRMAVIPSENHFEFPFPVSEIVAMGRYPFLGRLERVSTSDKQLVRRALRLTGTEQFAQRPISELSSGERQRVLMARAVAQQPQLLILDEPNAHLDIKHQISIFRLLQKLNQEQGVTIVVVLHDLSMTAAFCQRVAVMAEGRLILEGEPREVITASMIRRVYGAEVAVERTSDGVPLLSYRPDGGS